MRETRTGQKQGGCWIGIAVMACVVPIRRLSGEDGKDERTDSGEMDARVKERHLQQRWDYVVSTGVR